MSSGPDPVIGIDLGTTFSVVACLDRSGTPQTILNSEGDLSTPSVVYFEQSQVVVGKEALKAAVYEPESVLQHVKREMGKPACDKPIRGTRLPPEVVQAAILQKLRSDAQTKLGEVQEAVITVPAFFNEPRRKATMDAGRLAGLEGPGHHQRADRGRHRLRRASRFRLDLRRRETGGEDPGLRPRRRHVRRDLDAAGGLPIHRRRDRRRRAAGRHRLGPPDRRLRRRSFRGTALESTRGRTR